MAQKELSKLTDQELLQEAKRIRTANIINAVLAGVIMDIAIYSTVKNGFGLLTFLPLLFMYLGIKSVKNKKAVDNEIGSRAVK